MSARPRREVQSIPSTGVGPAPDRASTPGWACVLHSPAHSSKPPGASAMPSTSRVAIVTGASSGIGAELARQLGELGWRVGLTARRAELLEEVAGSIRARGGTAAVSPADAKDG